MVNKKATKKVTNSKQSKQSKLEKLLSDNNITEQELKNILNSASKRPSQGIVIRPSSKHVKFGYFSDPHIGHEQFSEKGFEYMRKQFDKEGVDLVLCPGDILEGMSGRPGHIYELTHIGFTQQAQYATDLLSQLKQPIVAITGNHDYWYAKKNNGGLIVGEDLDKRIKNYTHVGENEGDVSIDNIKIKLFHGADGTAYADSYKIQKLIESFSPGEKPNIVLSGHYHKALYLYRRGVHGFEAATLCGQSRYMRGKKIQAHTGFGICDMKYGNRGIANLTHTFYPINIEPVYKRNKTTIDLNGTRRQNRGRRT